MNSTYALLDHAWISNSRKILKTASAAAGLILLLSLLNGCADFAEQATPAKPEAVATTNRAVSTQPAATQAVDPAWASIEKIVERRGSLDENVDTITIPRDDLDVSIDGMGIPTKAGIASNFYFYRCPCGKMNVAGQFLVTDYESNDVMDALRKNAVLNVAGISPFLLYDRPHLVLIRFQGEGDPAALAGAVREALRWTGKERMAPVTQPALQ